MEREVHSNKKKLCVLFYSLTGLFSDLARVDNVDDIVDSERGLGDIGGHHHLPLACRRTSKHLHKREVFKKHTTAAYIELSYFKSKNMYI